MSDWLSVELTLPPDVDEVTIDVLSGALFEVGSAGIETRDGTKPIPFEVSAAGDATRDGSQPVVLIAAFGPDVPRDEVPARVEQALEEVQLSDVAVRISAVEPVDWSTHWRRHFRAMEFGPLWVVPTWLEVPSGARHVLRMDPGMAFGTGSHETTALCLERIAELSPVSAVLDVGTGTGILALAALRLGAGRAVGTDNDPDALGVARENAALNDLTLELTGAPPDAVGETFPLVVANILAQPLIEMAPALAAAVAPGGALVLSGLLVTQAEGVARAYEAAGLTGRTITTRGEWARVDLVRA
jgi:ribosomal protein L11 methyltransferase